MSEMTEDFIMQVIGEYEVQTVELISTTTDGALIITTEVPDGIGSLDFMWILACIITLVPLKITYDFMKWCFNYLTGSKNRFKL